MRNEYEKELRLYDENKKKDFEIFKSNLSKQNVQFVSPKSDFKNQKEALKDTIEKTDFVK